MAHPLIRLQQLGQSPWHDNISRELLTSGTLKKMVDGRRHHRPHLESDDLRAGDRAGSTTTTTDLRRFARKGKTADEIFDALAIEDIRAAADVLRAGLRAHRRRRRLRAASRWRRVSPTTPQATVREAHRLWKTVERART